MLPPVHSLTGTDGTVALAAAAIGIIALLCVLGLSLALRRVRAEQRVVLGDRRQDLVSHAVALQEGFDALQGYVEDVAGRLDARMATAESRLNGAIAYSSLVRYDAYGEMSGRQSVSIALLDATRTGIVLSSIHHRDQARLYAKQVRDGEGELELSPEEIEAVQAALRAGGQPAAR
jgi:hypothetical protein